MFMLHKRKIDENRELVRRREERRAEQSRGEREEGRGERRGERGEERRGIREKERRGERSCPGLLAGVCLQTDPVSLFVFN